jgi:hypothetical protein
MYVRSDELRPDPKFEPKASLVDWEALGKNVTGDHVTGYSFLVFRAGSRVSARRVHEGGWTRGKVRYTLDQLQNPESISVRLGGIFDSQKVLVCGHIGTASDSAVSITLYKAFAKAIVKGFQKVRNYHVGPEAIRLMDEGYRMVTVSVGSPPEWDLRKE